MNINPAWERAEDIARKAELKASEPKASAALKASAKVLRDKADALKAAPVTTPAAVAAPVVAAPAKAPAKLSLKTPAQSKASNGVTVAPKPEAPAAPKAPPVVAPPAPSAAPKPIEAPKPSPKAAPVAAPVVAFQPFWGVMLLGGGELAPCQVTGATTVGKGDKARPMHVVDVYGCAADAPDATTVSGMVKRGPVEGFAAVEGGIVVGQHNQTFNGMVVDPDAIMRVSAGSTMDNARALVATTLRAVWEPLTGVPAIGSTVRWFDPYSGGANPGAARPVDVTITEHRDGGKTVVGTVAGWKEPLHCSTTGEGRFYAVPPGVALPMLRDAFDAEWSARAVFHRTLGRHRDWDTMDSVIAHVAASRTVFASVGTSGVTF